jgi:glutathione synthase/RimK-type ligase-like ATP-grasp enzyme
LQTNSESDAILGTQAGLAYLGLAPFLRASIAGIDLRPATRTMLDKLAGHSGNAELLMNLSIAVQCLNQQPLGLEFQQEALKLQRSYAIKPSLQPARLRLLVLVTQGNIQANTPLECLLEQSDIELIFHYVLAGEALPQDLPAHDLLFVGISDSDANRGLLQELGAALEHWPCPVLNNPRKLHLTGRDQASRLLQDVPGLLAPATRRVSRAQLEALAAGQGTVAQLLHGCDYPVILRPLGSQAGADLQKVDSAEGIAAYLAQLPQEDFFMAPFMDYSDDRGQFRKIRIALIAGRPYVCHMAISSHWMIHYVNAGMYEEAWKRSEEARFMQDFPQFVHKHRLALDAIAERMQLDYLVMDCAEARTGELLLFEIDHGGVVHAMDVESLFPYKNGHILQVKEAFCALLQARLPQAGLAADMHEQAGVAK